MIRIRAHPTTNTAAFLGVYRITDAENTNSHEIGVCKHSEDSCSSPY